MNQLKYTTCPECKTRIILTSKNRNGLCPFRFCKNNGFNSMQGQDEELQHYIGKSIFSVELEDVIHCIDIVDRNKLVCITIGYPTILVLSSDEFEIILNRNKKINNEKRDALTNQESKSALSIFKYHQFAKTF